MQNLAVSGLVLHCLPISYKKDARFIWDNMTTPFSYKPVNEGKYDIGGKDRYCLIPSVQTFER